MVHDEAGMLLVGSLEQIRQQIQGFGDVFLRAEEMGAVERIAEVAWNAGDALQEDMGRGSFRSVAIFNKGPGTMRVSFDGPAAVRSDANATWLLRPFDSVVLPYKGATVYYGGAAAGAATIVFLRKTQTFEAIAGGAGGAAGAPAFIVGDSGSGIADPGTGPVKVGGVFRATAPTFADGQRGDLALGQRGEVMLGAGTSGVDGITPFAALLRDISGTARTLAVGGYVYNGASWDRPRAAAVFKPINALALALTTDTAIWTPTAGKKFRLIGYQLTFSVAARLVFKDNAAGTVIWVVNVQAGVNVIAPPGIANGILSAAANNVLNVNASAAGTLDGAVYGTEE